MQIRLGTVKDIVEVAVLWESLVKETMENVSPKISWWMDNAYKLLMLKDYMLIVAVHEGRVVGFVDGMFTPDPTIGEWVAVNRHMYVVPECRDKAVAGLMHRLGIREAERRGVYIHRYFVGNNEKHLWATENCVAKETMYEEDRRKEK